MPTPTDRLKLGLRARRRSHRTGARPVALVITVWPSLDKTFVQRFQRRSVVLPHRLYLLRSEGCSPVDPDTVANLSILSFSFVNWRINIMSLPKSNWQPCTHCII